MANVTVQEYNRINDKIEAARKAEDWKAVRRWRNKLEKWQEAYGSYSPVTAANYHRREW